MDDSVVQDHIEELVAEERRLYDAAGREGGHTIEERARLEEIRVSLDRYWTCCASVARRRSSASTPTM